MAWKKDGPLGVGHYSDREIDRCLEIYERPKALIPGDRYAQFLKLSETFVACFVWDDHPGGYDTPCEWAIYERVEG
jgi:hypothetical protein